MTIYDRLRTGAVPRLMTRFKTGTVEIRQPTATEGTDPWDAPTVTGDWEEVDAVVFGVTEKMMQGTALVGDERVVIGQFHEFDPEAGHQIRIDGKIVTVVQVKPIMAAGEPVATRLVTRG